MKKNVVKSLITSKGYGIFLNSISGDDLELLKNALTVKPVVLTDYDFGDDTSFPVYRLSDTRIYVPRFYGLKKYGPSEIKIRDGLDVTGLTFEGSLKDHQIDFCNNLLKELKTNNSCIACALTGSGKCHAINTPIIMFDGSIKMVQDIQIGDKLMGDDSTSREVLSLGRGKDIMYEIIPTNGESYTFNSEHILCLKLEDSSKSELSERVYEVSIKDYIKLPNILKYNLKLYRTSVEFPSREVPFDPYLIGYWLGDIKNLVDNKHIPDLYKINSREIRLNLLAGLIDSGGYFRRGCYEFPLSDKTITSDGIIYLTRSLGFATSIKLNRIIISLNIHEIPCKIKHLAKIEDEDGPQEQKRPIGFTVVEKPRDDYYGFELDGNHRYLLGDFTVTHNTTVGLWLASQLKKRTLVVVHKEFLLNQWVDRIKQFLPNASIGIIQQNKCEVDKDIIIGMIQTLVKRDYPPGTFDSIGLCLADECHHLACKGFSQLFFKIGTKNTLALSATPTRADGLTKVLEWFLGKIIKNEIVSEIEKPMIKFIEAEYSSSITPKFNFKGNLNAPNMVNQLVLDANRNKQVVDEVIRLNKEGRKVLVLSGRRGHCEYFDEQFKLQNLSSGLYLGGMKNQDLEISNQADIVIATFSMASEAYDNPALDTLVMATGMGAVTQSIGRILRRKNKFRPLVVDFTDILYFGGQARRRKQYYKKSGYEIIGSHTQKEAEATEECMFES